MVVEIIGINIGVQIYLMHLGAVLEGFADACGGYFGVSRWSLTCQGCRPHAQDMVQKVGLFAF